MAQDDLEVGGEQLETPAVETPVVETPAPPEEPATLRDALTQAIEDQESETPEQKAERLRDERGRFAKAEAEKAAKPDAAKAQAETPAAKPATEGFKPPRSWKAEAVAEWNKLPPQVQAEVHRREADVQRVMQEHAQTRQIVDSIGSAIQPYAANIQATGMPAVELVKQFFQADHELRHGNARHKAQVIANVINTYGVDIAQLDEVLSQGPTKQADPMADLRRQIAQELRQELAPAMNAFQALQQQQSAAQQRIAQEAAAEIEAMQTKPFFDELRNDMADIMEMNARRGVVLTLEQAYDKAAKLHPKLSESLVQQQAAERARNATRAAHRARGAAVSVGGGAPAGHGAPTGRGAATLREAIEAAVDAQQDQ